MTTKTAHVQARIVPDSLWRDPVQKLHRSIKMHLYIVLHLNGFLLFGISTAIAHNKNWFTLGFARFKHIQMKLQAI